eukprot:TRINITY_DN3313_c0_g1_i4.p1 TRINITY_DN3313_c0_g1~~TRINITY_DN3313_c0_g1_i4.p1  ORF type:complete len:423 (+),score=103.94 TRINITY_DN3313_c0_g1_i4:73-1341(+)
MLRVWCCVMLVAASAAGAVRVSDAALRTPVAVVDHAEPGATLRYVGTLRWLLGAGGDRSGAARLAVEAGYPAEVHRRVPTDDGYFLTALRLANPGKPVVLFTHGLMTNGAAWVSNLPHNDLAFMLYDAGFDVWVAHFRGTKDSLAHRYLSVHSQQYWDFSVTEYALYDLPAMLDLITANAGQRSVILVGHSEGASSALAMLSLLPRYADTVSLLVALAPSAYLQHSTQPVISFASKFHIVDTMKLLHITHFTGFEPIGSFVQGSVCHLMPRFCSVTMNAIAGWDLPNMNYTRTEVFVQAADTASTHHLAHLVQLYNTNRFGMFDYGPKINLRVYLSADAPLFPIGNVTTPVALFYGGKDCLVSKIDIEQNLLRVLRPATIVHRKFIPTWNHLDFVRHPRLLEPCLFKLVAIACLFPQARAER